MANSHVFVVLSLSIAATAPSSLSSLRLERRLAAAEVPSRAPTDPEEPATTPPTDMVAESEAPLSPLASRDEITTPNALRGIYDKPFLTQLWRRAHFGGYTEFEYHSFEDGILGISEGFRMHRTNLFFFTELGDRVRFGSEIEFETEFDGGELEGDIEVNVEMAFVDWTIFQEFVIRGGALLVPLGRINVNHDGPAREFTERPLISTFVIPTTLTEPGIGAHGTLNLSDSLDLTYEAYAVNGFNLLDSNGDLEVAVTDTEQLLREGRTSISGDVNGNPAGTGRIATRFAELFEIGGSWHVGTYDERSDNILSIFAGDWAFVYELNGFDLGFEGEIAVAEFERDDFAKGAGVPDQFWGYYLQASVGHMPAFLRNAVPYIFDDRGARFTAAIRFDWVDLDGDRGEVIEPGITFRPGTDTIFKFSYRFGLNSVGLRDVPGREDFDDDGFVFSLASYF